MPAPSLLESIETDEMSDTATLLTLGGDFMEFSHISGSNEFSVVLPEQFELGETVEGVWFDTSVKQEFAMLGVPVVTLELELTLLLSSRDTHSDISSSENNDLASELPGDWDFDGENFERGLSSKTMTGGN